MAQVGMLLRRMAGLAAPKASVVLEPMLAFVASHEACRRMAVCTRQQTGNYTKPASREARCRAAVSPQPTGVSPEHSRALWARCGVKGYYPLREARCRAAVSPQPTGVSPEHSRALWARCEVKGYYPLREACCRAAVKPRPARISHEHPARLCRAEMGAGL